MSRRRALFTEADIRRACRAAPGAIIEIVLPDGAKLRIVQGEKQDVKLLLAPKKNFRL
jgi:hypothetical protein